MCLLYNIYSIILIVPQLYIIILLVACFFTPVLAGRLLMETEWQQVFSGLQDISKYSSRS